MPRPKSILWDKRVDVFLAYRAAGGKVYPIAKRYGIARSTVSAIVNEFKALGFSEGPRAAVSQALLENMQKEHLRGLPQTATIGQLDLTPGTDEASAGLLSTNAPLPMPEELRWHLKGTTAERIIEEARDAASDFHCRDYEAWRDLRVALENACHLTMRKGQMQEGRPPCLLPALVGRMRNLLMPRVLGEAPPPPPGKLEWDVAPDDPAILRLDKEQVAIGSEEDHERVKNGVAAFFVESFRNLQRRFVEVERLRRDLGLVQELLRKAVDGVEQSVICRGICPACPYPESRPAPDQSQKPGRNQAAQANKGVRVESP